MLKWIHTLGLLLRSWIKIWGISAEIFRKFPVVVENKWAGCLLPLTRFLCCIYLSNTYRLPSLCQALETRSWVTAPALATPPPTALLALWDRPDILKQKGAGGGTAKSGFVGTLRQHSLGWGEEWGDGWEVLPGRKAAGQNAGWRSHEVNEGTKRPHCRGWAPTGNYNPWRHAQPFLLTVLPWQHGLPFSRRLVQKVPANRLHSSHKLMNRAKIQPLAGEREYVLGTWFCHPCPQSVPKTREDATGRQPSQTSKPVITEKGQS